jgi:hypothetical protein
MSRPRRNTAAAVHLERGLRPRNEVLGEVRKGAEPPPGPQNAAILSRTRPKTLPTELSRYTASS